MKLRLFLLACSLFWPFAVQAAPVNFSLPALDGKTIYTAAELRGRVVVLNFIADWCPICQGEAVDLERAHQAYKDKGVVFLNVFVMSKIPEIKAFVDKYQMTIPFGVDEQMARQFAVRGVPVAFFIDREGVVRQRRVGKMGFDDFREEIERLL